MAEFQISKIQLRRGAELDLPGKPSKLSPLTFESGLDSGELGFTEDTNRLFIGVSPTTGQPNYKRTTFPYQNLEILTEASTETLQRIFNFLERDVGGGGFYTATLQPTGDGDWQDVKVDRAYGSATAFRLPGEEIIAAVEYHLAEQADDGVFPLRTGAIRFMSESGVEECWAKDDSLSLRRLDLPTPQAMDTNLVFENVTLRLLRGGAIGDRYFRLQYTSIGDLPVRLWFRIERPLAYTGAPFDTGRTTSGSVSGNPLGGIAYSQTDVRQIVGNMLRNDSQVGIQVTYDDCGGTLNFAVETAPVVAAYSFVLNFGNDVSGAVGVTNTTGPSYAVPLSLTPTGVTPGTYYVPTLTIDRNGRITAAVNGTIPAAADPNAIYNALNVGTGADLFASVNGRSLQFRTLTAGDGVTITSSATEVMIALTPPEPTEADAPPSATYVNRGGAQALSGITATGSTPMQWSTIATLGVAMVAGQARTIAASAMIGAQASGFPVARYLRLSIGGTPVYTATQPWGEPWMGGQLAIEYLDTDTTRDGTVSVTLDVAYVATNNGAAGFTADYSVYNTTLNVFGFSGSTAASTAAYSAPTTV